MRAEQLLADKVVVVTGAGRGIGGGIGLMAAAHGAKVVVNDLGGAEDGSGSDTSPTHALMKTCCDYDPSRFKRMRLRFSAPVYPGETIRTEIWRNGKEVWFRCKSLPQDKIVTITATC